MKLLPAPWTDTSKRARAVAVPLTIVAGVVALAAIPLIYILLKAVLGMLALGVGVVAALALMRFAPAVNMMAANRALKAMKLEARRNPIETLERGQIDKAERLKVFADAVSLAKAAISQYKAALGREKKLRPHDDFSDVEAHALRLELVAQKLDSRLSAARVAFNAYTDKVESSKAKFRMYQEAAKVGDALGKFDGDKILQGILEDEAFKSVDLSMETELISLEHALASEMEAMPQLGIELKLPAPATREPAYVRRS